MIYHTEENIETLASRIVEGMDLDDLIEYAVDRMSEYFRENKEAFMDDWDEVMEDE